MYTVLVDRLVLFDPNIEGYEIFAPKVHLEVNKAGRFEFKIYPTHPRYNRIKKLVSVIEVYQQGVLIFRGRPLNDDIDFDNGKVVQCEGDFAFFNDSIQRPYEYSGGVQEYLQFLIDRHNSQVGDDKKFTVGTVTVTDPNDYIVRADSQYLTTMEIMNAKLIKYLGGYIRLRHVDGVNYIDYLEDSKYRSDQEIKIGENMLDLHKSLRGSAICTAIIPTGATIESEDENIEDYVVDITSVNNDKDYIYHEEAVKKWGWIYKHFEYENITLPENLKKRAIRELDGLVNYIENIEIKAIDRNMYDGDFHRFRIFEYVKVVSENHGLDDFFLIKKQTINLTNPSENTIEIGSEKSTISDTQTNIKNELNVIRDESVTINNKITETYQNLSLTIAQSAETYSREIKEELSNELDQLRSETSTEFEQTKNEFLFQFTNMIEQIEGMDDDTRTQFEEIVKYIRFVDGSIILGQIGNQLELRISNDRMSFVQNNTEVAYLNDNRLYITDGEFLNSLQIGNFAFVPRANGNLSFVKVVN